MWWSFTQSPNLWSCTEMWWSFTFSLKKREKDTFRLHNWVNFHVFFVRKVPVSVRKDAICVAISPPSFPTPNATFPKFRLPKAKNAKRRIFPVSLAPLPSSCRILGNGNYRDQHPPGIRRGSSLPLLDNRKTDREI